MKIHCTWEQGQFGFGHPASEDGTGLWKGDFTYMIFMTEVGYRWYGNGMFLVFGAQAGIASHSVTLGVFESSGSKKS